MTNAEIINSFYTAFQNLDSKKMNSLLAEDVVFEDPAFGILKGNEVKFMWQMLTSNAKEFSLEFKDVIIKEDNGTANWEAKYLFGKTKNLVHNKIHANFVLKEGKIKNHLDSFDLKNWVTQAMGPFLGIFGNTFFMKYIVRKQSLKLLQSYMKKNQLL